MALEEKMQDISFWFYRGEGNDTMVVGLRGKNLVLRLKKRSRQETHVCRSCVKDQNHHDKSLEFSKHVFLPLMGGQYVRVGEVVRLPDGFAAKLDVLCEPFRPKHRLHKAIDVCAIFAVAMPDFCLLPEDKPWSPHLDVAENVQDNWVTGNTSSTPTFSVEIKPKCGFIPSSLYIKEEHSVKLTTCCYCMLQRKKIAEGKYTRPSQYCPVDLFSGDISRVFVALQSLVCDPQNNLRIFKDGCPIFTHEIVQDAVNNEGVCCSAYVLEETLMNYGWLQGNISPLHRSTHENHICDKLEQHSNNFLRTLLKILIHDSNISQNISNSIEFGKQVCKGNEPASHIEDNLVQDNEIKTFGCSGVLQWLNQIQRMDDMDVEGIYPLYLTVKKYFEHNRKERERFSVDGPYETGIWNDVSSTNSTNDIQGTHFRKLRHVDSWSTRDTVFKICQFAVASTAKDCSIMLSFQKRFAQPKHLPFIVSDTLEFKEYVVYDIDLVDLDPKEFDRVQKYYNDSCNVVKQYLKAP